jgi:TRAP-type C4-dicarboxylate transport system permease small subunit
MMHQVTPAAGFPKWWADAAFFFGFVCMACHSAIKILVAVVSLIADRTGGTRHA